MKLIFCLGNPGSEYNATRHNVGFFVADSLIDAYGGSFQDKPKFKAAIAELSISSSKIIVAKPQTFYNDVGESLRAIMDFYKLDSNDVLVIHDELSLPYGTYRVRTGGTDAGNNGIKSVNLHGGNHTVRLRIGIYDDTRKFMEATNFVLGRFTHKDNESLKKLLPHIYASIEKFANGSIEHSSYSLE